MKKLYVCLFVFVNLLLNPSFLSAQVVVTDSVIREISNTLNSLFNVLKSGDVRSFQSYLLPEEYARYKVLFEQNKEYPGFLRNFYQGASLRVGHVDSVLSTENEVIADFIVDFPGGESIVTRMRLKNDNGSIWKVKKILADKNDQGEPSGEGRR